MPWTVKISLMLLLFFYALAIFAPFFSPYNYKEQNRKLPNSPPSNIRIIDEQGQIDLPFIYDNQLIDIGRQTYREDKSQKYYLTLFPQPTILFGLSGNPENVRLFVLGSDDLGRDLLSRIIYGGRVSLFIGICGVMVSFTIGTIVGAMAGYFGGRTDDLAMRICEILMSLPSFYFLLTLSVLIPSELSSSQTFFLIVLIMSFISWAGFARVIRGLVASIRKREFVVAAEALGGSHTRVLFRHVIPTTFNYSIIAMTLSIPGYILGESGLSLLGLGIREPDASWGNLLTAAMNVNAMVDHPWILLPGVFIFLTIMSFNFLGDWLRDTLDPRGDFSQG
jgi:peptide/nickel transport system permease protein